MAVRTAYSFISHINSHLSKGFFFDIPPSNGALNIPQRQSIHFSRASRGHFICQSYQSNMDFIYHLSHYQESFQLARLPLIDKLRNQATKDPDLQPRNSTSFRIFRTRIQRFHNTPKNHLEVMLTLSIMRLIDAISTSTASITRDRTTANELLTVVGTTTLVAAFMRSWISARLDDNGLGNKSASYKQQMGNCMNLEVAITADKLG